MKKMLLALGLLVLLDGCTREIHHYHTKEVTISQPKQVQRREPIQQFTQQNSSIDKDSCDILYTTYQQCYGLGIQVHNTDMCISSGGRLAERISSELGSRQLGTTLGTICAVACESANRNMAMPSYSEFSSNSCN